MTPPLLKTIVAAGLMMGAAMGIGTYTFVYARGASYLSDDPAACANCHVMNEHFDGWIRSSHRSVATCNDCHTPPGLVPKYLNKASNGFWHSYGFTTGNFPDPLRITPGNARVTEQACRKCHAPVTAAIDPSAHGSAPALRPREESGCVKCHSNVGHWVR